MKFMVFVKLTGQTAADYELGKMPSEQEISRMMTFNEQLANAGVILDGQGFQPTSKGARVEFTDAGPAIANGPFPETRELIGGYWIWQVESRQMALEWASKCPMEKGDLLELRQIFEMEDFGKAISEHDRQLAERIDAQKQVERDSNAPQT